MKFTSFHPLILTKDADSAIAVFEALGFEKRHQISVTPTDYDIPTICMKHPDGYHVDIAHVRDVSPDMTLIRINVDNFDEAYEFLISKGFTNPSGENKTVDTRTNKSCMMRSPSGFAFDLCQHIKD